MLVGKARAYPSKTLFIRKLRIWKVFFTLDPGPFYVFNLRMFVVSKSVYLSHALQA
jgi:hypothetical protein